MTEPIFTTTRLDRVRAAADRAVPFLDRANFPLGAAWVRHHWQGGSSRAVIDALAAYQQPDGGFAGLEVDIGAPVSTAFDGRLAMYVLLGLPDVSGTDVAQRLGAWFAHSQHDDGDWHFPSEVYEHRLAPWFAAWEFPGLNPACCVAGLAHALGIAPPEMLDRVARLWEAQATGEQARSGDFYPMLPIVEYVAHVVKVIDAVLDDQQEDGGWPTPYDPAWRPWFTASTLVLLARLHRTVV